MKRSLTSTLAMLASVIVVGGCAATTSSDDGQPRSRDRNLIVAAEIEATGARNAYEVVERLRPQWLTVTRGGATSFYSGVNGILVYHDQTRLGGVEALKTYPTGAITRMKFLDASTASATLPGIGSGHVAGAIVIETR